MTQGSRTFSRRTVMAGACGVACAATVAGCAGYVGGGQQKPPASGGGGATTSGGGAGGSGGGAIASTADIPVGGGKIFADEQIVITQPKAGTFKAWDTTCTHDGCAVTKVGKETIDCPCHGSKYSIEDASVVAGPAPAPLAKKQIKVSGDKITLA